MRGPSVVLARLSWTFLSVDWVSGAVITATVIVSFLSLMSFADFLRLQIHHGDLRANRRPPRFAEEPHVDPTEADIDNELWARSQDKVAVQLERNPNVGLSLDDELHQQFQDDNNDDSSDETWEPDDEGEGYEDWENDHDYDDDDDFDDEDEGDDEVDSDDSDSEGVPFEGENDVAPLEPFERELERQFLNAPANNENNNAPPRQAFQRNDARLDRNLDDDDGLDMDINIALDELLGIRGGALGPVIRNLLWLLLFNALYLGFFMFTPRVVGMAVNSLLFNSSSFLTPTASLERDNSTNRSAVESAWNVTEVTLSSPLTILRAIEAESERLNTPFKLSDLFGVTTGYFACAALILVVRGLIHLSRKFRFFRIARGGIRIGRVRNEGDGGAAGGAPRDALDEINRIMVGNPENPFGADEQGIALAFAVGVAFDVMTAIVKVGMLLLLKMFLLPIALGICLDASTLSLFGSSLESRIGYAGRDLFSFTLLHWVVGITFMLLVTVSVLQLREVAHPALLAQVIRPQEPQPDLLGNLMHESVSTHAKRMVLSIVIYAVLLSIHVYFPIRLIACSNLLHYLPFLKFKVWYVVMPQLQIPLELLLFHLCMLGILEKNKNSIGELQYHWFKFLGRLLNLTGALLPRVVAEFRLVGSRPIFNGLAVDPFWVELAKADKKREDMIIENLPTFSSEEEEPSLHVGETKANGERVLRFGSDFIRLPVHPSGPSVRSRSLLLPTTLGRYRLKRDAMSAVPVFQLWEEVPGEPISRPPEGWDDLGAGGADVQGRWAWSREKKSNLERGVAHRDKFYRESDDFAVKFVVYAKLLVMAILSWAMTTAVLACIFTGPLAVGRALHIIFRVPDSWIHDPFTFALGSLFFFPLLRVFVRNTVCTEVSATRKLFEWASHFHFPPLRKLLIVVNTTVLSAGIVPVLIGFVLDLAIIRSKDWFMGQEKWIDARSVFFNWLSGCILFLLWIELCLGGFVGWRAFAVLFDGPRPEQVNANIIDDDQAPQGQRDDTSDDSPRIKSRSAWQGRDGRVARFVAIVEAIAKFEWDKVDNDVLIRDFALPVAGKVALTVVFPILSLALSEWGLPIFPITHRRAFTRSVLLAALVAQMSSLWERRVRLWFESAHRAALDERYLIGEVLLNYSEH